MRDKVGGGQKVSFLFSLVNSISGYDAITHEENWDFERNGHERTMVRQAPPPQAFP